MRKILFKTIFLLIFIVSPFWVEKVSACQCFGIGTVYQSLEDAKVVFTGKVVEKNTDKGRIYSFEIIEAFKGLSPKQVKINVANSENMCESGFETGKSYLIYAHGENEKNLYTNSFCSRNERLSYAQDQVFYLRELLKGKPEPQIYGSVARYDIDPNTNESSDTPLQNIKITVEGEGKHFEVSTDKNGLFRFDKIPKGRYIIKSAFSKVFADSSYPSEPEFLVLSSGKVITGAYSNIFSEPLYDEKEAENISLARGAIADGIYVEFSLRWNNRVEGKVFDLEGKPLGHAKVDLLPVATPFKEITSRNRIDYSGKYRSAGLTPARYYLVAEVDAPFVGRDKARFFYPQAEVPEKATVISIKETDNLELDMIVPVIMRKIEGKIFWSDGAPIVGDVRVVLSKSENPTDDELRENNYDVTSLDGESRFSLNGYVGAEYWIQILVFAETFVNEEKTTRRVKAKPIKIKVEKTNEPLKILIPKPDNQPISN